MPDQSVRKPQEKCMNDLEAMRMAIACAHTVEGRTSPRPSVGAVVIREGVIVGQGATSPPYGPHAEIHALNQAGPAAAGADLYVTLEPCCVTIHTPPCTKAIIKAGIRRVIIGSLDPNPLVYEQGIAQLRAAGIEVLIGVAAQETDEIVRPFNTFVKELRPYVTAKWAMTLDGKIATRTGDSRWISGPQARAWVHNLRDRVDAIMIGSGTAHADNPQLTVRLTPEQREYERIPREGPLRVVLSTNGQLDEHLNLLQPELATHTCVIVGEACPQQQIQHLLDRGLSVEQVPCTQQGQVDLAAVLAALARQGIMHVLLEGGASLLGSAFDHALIDHIAVFIAPKIIGGAGAPSPLKGLGLARMQDALQLQQMHSRTIGNDLLIEGELVH
jgi:diaminohydroxyphosphoribosylaminopyrimidine deaminase/5-amino-6-(5-phosphoribosylamino)uracil reductase